MEPDAKVAVISYNYGLFDLYSLLNSDIDVLGEFKRVFVNFTKTLFLACYYVYMLKEQLHNMLPSRWVGDSSPTM